MYGMSLLSTASSVVLPLLLLLPWAHAPVVLVLPLARGQREKRNTSHFQVSIWDDEPGTCCGSSVFCFIFFVVRSQKNLCITRNAQHAKRKHDENKDKYQSLKNKTLKNKNNTNTHVCVGFATYLWAAALLPDSFLSSCMVSCVCLPTTPGNKLFHTLYHLCISPPSRSVLCFGAARQHKKYIRLYYLKTQNTS